MHRIDGSTATATLPTPNPVSGTPGYFQHGDLATSTPYTYPTPDWANAVQEEILAVIEAAGIAADKTNHAQLLAALYDLFVAKTAPSFTHSGSDWRRVGPDGFIECGGIQSLGTTNEQAFSFNFATAFPNACLGIHCTMITTSNTLGDTQMQEVSLTATTANLFIQSDSHPFSDTTSFRWRAWGY